MVEERLVCISATKVVDFCMFYISSEPKAREVCLEGDYPWSRSYYFCISAAKVVVFCIFCICGQPEASGLYLEAVYPWSRNDFSAFLLRRYSFSAFSAFRTNPKPGKYTSKVITHGRGMTFLHFAATIAVFCIFCIRGQCVLPRAGGCNHLGVTQ